MSITNPHFCLLNKIKCFERRIKKLDEIVQVNDNERAQLEKILNDLNKIKGLLVIDSFDTVMHDYAAIQQKIVEEFGTNQM